MTAAEGLIRRAVLERFAVESQWIDVSPLSVEVGDGMVSLRGELDDRADALGLAWELTRLPGVSDVEITGLRFRLEPDPRGQWRAGDRR
jgi:osmotically-inducible protein OsmY